MPFAYLIFIYALSLQVFCFGSWGASTKNVVNFENLINQATTNYFYDYNEYCRKKQYDSSIQEPVNFETLVRHNKQIDLIKSACEDYCNNLSKSETTNNAILVENFWVAAKIDAMLAFKSYYDQTKKQLDDIKKKFESMKFNDETHKNDDIIIDEFIHDFSLFKDFQQSYDNSYTYHLGLIHEKSNFIPEKILFSITWTNECRRLCSYFLRKNLEKLSGDLGKLSTNLGESFYSNIIDTFTYIKGDFVEDDRPNSRQVKEFFRSIIENNAVFSGCIDFSNSLENQKYPGEMIIKLQTLFSKSAIDYYSRRLKGETEIEPEDQVAAIEREAMSTIRIEYQPSILAKFSLKNPQNMLANPIASLIADCLFDKIEYKSYPELDRVTNEVIEYLQYPFDQDQIKKFIDFARCDSLDAIRKQKDQLFKLIHGMRKEQLSLEKNKRPPNYQDEAPEIFNAMQASLDFRATQLEIEESRLLEFQNQLNEQEKHFRISQIENKKWMETMQATCDEQQQKEKDLDIRKTCLDEAEKKLGLRQNEINTQQEKINTEACRLKQTEEKLNDEKVSLNKIQQELDLRARRLTDLENNLNQNVNSSKIKDPNLASNQIKDEKEKNDLKIENKKLKIIIKGLSLAFVIGLAGFLFYVRMIGNTQVIH